MILREIIEMLEGNHYHSEHGPLESDPAFIELKLIASKRPGIRCVQWYYCKCDTPARRMCMSEHPEGKCIGGTNEKPNWVRCEDVEHDETY